jgi:hypothetical protein
MLGLAMLSGERIDIFGREISVDLRLVKSTEVRAEASAICQKVSVTPDGRVRFDWLS